MAAPSYQQSGAETSQTTQPVSVAYPASGLASGDVAIMVGVYNATANTSITWNNGFAGLDGSTGAVANTTIVLAAAWKRLDGTETGTTSVGWGSSGSVRRVLWMAVFRDCVAAGTPFEAFSGTTGTGTVATAPTCTTTDADRLVLNCYAARNGVTVPSGYTNFTSEKLFNASSTKLELMHRTAATATGYAGDAITVHSSAVEWAAFSVALLPASSSAGMLNQFRRPKLVGFYSMNGGL